MFKKFFSLIQYLHILVTPEYGRQTKPSDILKPNMIKTQVVWKLSTRILLSLSTWTLPLREAFKSKKRGNFGLGPKYRYFYPLRVKISTLAPLCFMFYYIIYKLIKYKKFKIPQKNCIPLLGPWLEVCTSGIKICMCISPTM